MRALKRQLVRLSPFPILLVALVLIAAAAVLMLRIGNPASVGDAKLTNIRTYLGSDGVTEKKATTDFRVGDPVQVGFGYSKLDERQADEALVRFVVINRQSKDEAFTTSLFRLDHTKDELFVNINNSNLPAGSYTVELRDSADNVVAERDFRIKAT